MSGLAKNRCCGVQMSDKEHIVTVHRQLKICCLINACFNEPMEDTPLRFFLIGLCAHAYEKGGGDIFARIGCLSLLP